jgi:hypothetical protein
VDYTADLKRAFEALKSKASDYAKLFAYYDGEQPLVYSASRLRDLFRGIDARFTENWCAVVVDTLVDRLTLSGISVSEKAANATQAKSALSAFWAGEQLFLESDEINENAAICGESYMIVWPEDDDAGGKVLRAHHNDPRLCHIFYSGSDSKQKAFAAKWWVGDDGLRYLTLYYPNEFVHFASTRKASQVSGPGSMRQLGEPEPNEYGIVPVFHFRTRQRRVRGELAGRAIEIQDGLNKEVADMMVGSEFRAVSQRYAITNADVSGVRAAAGTITKFPPAKADDQPVQVGEFTASDLTNFLKVIEHFAASMAAVTRTPRSHFFETGANISGDALVAMEAPLEKKAKRYQERLGVTWREIAVFVLKLSNVEVAFEGTTQPVSEAQAAKTWVDAGVPLRTVLRRAGWSEEDLLKLDEDLQADETRQASIGDQVMAAARVRFDQGNPPQGA